MSEEDRVRVLHMIDAAETALDFISGHQQADLNSNKMLSFALVRAIEVIGEAASKMSQAVQVDTPEIPWRRIVSMRNRLIHAYFDIDHEILWQTVSTELPSLLPRLKALIDGE